MDFTDSLLLMLIDKVLIAGIAFYIWHIYSKNKEQDKEEKDKKNSLEEQIQSLEAKEKETDLNEKILVLEQQLEKFYWPFSLCMKNDDAVWQRVPSLYDDGTQLPTKSGNIVENEFLIPNHEKAVKLISSNYHLIAGNEKFIKELIKYIRHVAVFKSLRLSKTDLNPIDVDEPFPSDMISMLDNETKKKNRELNKLKRERWNVNA